MKSGKIMVFEGVGIPLREYTREIHSLLPGEILIKNLYTTLCGSDIHTYCGLRKEACPGVLGHEIVGRVAEIGKVEMFDLHGDPVRIGDLVTWSIYASVPDTIFHPQGMPQKSPGLYKYGHQQLKPEDSFHGGLAEYCILKPHTAILKIPTGIPLPLAATLNCAISTVAGAIRICDSSIQGKKIFISGMGLLGITAAAMLRKEGAAYIAGADISDSRLQKAKAFGLDETFHFAEDKHQLPDQKMDIVFDMSGSPEAMEAGLRTLGVGGKAIWVGAVYKQRDIHLNAEYVLRNMLTIKGLHNYNYDDFQYALSFITQYSNDFPFDQVVEKEFNLEEAEQAFEYAKINQPFRVGIKIGNDEL